MKSAIAALFISSALAAASAQAANIDLSTFTLNGNGATDTNYAYVTGDSSITGVVNNLTSFQWNFRSGDYLPYNDTSFFVTTSYGTVTLADVSSVGTYGSSGWQTFTLGTPYSGSITFGVANGLDQLQPSTLEVSDVTAVPEPESYAMMLAGLALVGGIARRRARKAV